ncbi:MAG TPA: GDP-mannose 4,6-dehydratase [Chloroflexota bacterium]
MLALITGASGFVGPHLARHLHALGQEVHGLGRREPVVGYDAFYRADLMDAAAMQRVIGEAHPEVIYHLAAQSAVPQSWEDPAGTIVNNLVGEVNLLEAVRHAEIDPVIVVAVSSEVYGLVPAEANPVNEDVPFRPLSPYAVSKAAQDLLSFQYAAGRGMRIIRMRTFNHLGPGQSDRFAIPSFARQVAEIEAGQRPPLLETGDLSAERDFTDVRDIVRAYALAADRGRPGEAYNVGSGVGSRIGDLLQMLVAQCLVPIEVRQDPTRLRPADVPRMVCDPSRFHAATGWTPTISLEQSLREVLQDWRARVAAHAHA